MEKEKTCCFTGHRIMGKDFNADTLVRGIRYLITEKGVDTFISGGALGFDTVAAREVLKIKREFPEVKLCIIAPCSNQDAKWSILQKMEYSSILKKADLVQMPDYAYYEGCMKERNYSMVNQSAYCIAYLNNYRSGTSQTFSYAKKMGLTVYNIAGKE